MKVTPGTVDTACIQPISADFDSIGGFGKTPEDLANVLSVLYGEKDYISDLKASWDGLAIGIVDPELWQAADFVVEPNEGFKKQTVNFSTGNTEITSADIESARRHA